jgi:Flp pilus assembly protein TadB
MKYITSLTILLSIIALPAHSELTPTDLDKIREIVKETVSESEKRTKEYVNIKFDSLEKNVNERFNSVDERMTHQANITYGLMVLVAVAIGFPAWRSQKDRSLEKQMEALTQEIEILKKQRIQSP